MSTPADPSLHGREVALVGRLWSLTRDEAIDAIQAAGGSITVEPTARTAAVVIGDDGWPLRDDGQIARPLQRVAELQRQGAIVEIITEAELLSRLGLEQHRADLERLFTTTQLSNLLGIAVRRLRAWITAGLIRPKKSVRGLDWFDFTQVARARTLHSLTQSGVKPARLAKSLTMLERWLPEAACSRAWLALQSSGRSVIVRLEDGRLVDPSGQLHFDFESSTPPAPVHELRTSRTCGADDWFEQGVTAEDQGQLDAAEHAYHRALLAGGPEATIAFNLGNVLYAANRKAEAVQRFSQAAEIEPAFAAAWNNLGNALSDLNRLDQAIDAYRSALRCDPAYGDVHYNLAETLERADREDEARFHWEAYLRFDQDSDWAAQARRRLTKEDRGPCILGPRPLSRSDRPRGPAVTERGFARSARPGP